MSKRGSRTSINFLTKSWKFIEANKFSKSIIEKQEEIISLQSRWEKISKQLNFEITNVNKKIYDHNQLIFIERPKYVLEILKRYKLECKKKGLKYDFITFCSYIK